MCDSRKYPYPHHGRLFDLHYPTPRIFHSRGSLMTPSPLPPGISRIFEQELLTTRKKFKVVLVI